MPRLCEFATDVPAVVLPAVLDFTDTWYVGELVIYRLVRLLRRTTAGQVQVAVRTESQPFRSLQRKGLLGERLSEDAAQGLALWKLTH